MVLQAALVRGWGVSGRSRDVAREAGVSQSTVSRALRGDSRISRETRERVLSAAERLSYVPNTLGRNLATMSTGVVGVVVSDIENPFYPELLSALHRELLESRYQMVLFAERTGISAEGLLKYFASGAADGVILATATLVSPIVERIEALGLPLVFVNRYTEGVKVDSALADNAEGGFLAGRYLVELGHRRIGFISGQRDVSTSRDRELGFRRALESAGVPLPEALTRGGAFSHQGGFEYCTELLGIPEPPTAVFCANDVIAFGALDAARRLSIPVPEQLSVLGFDDLAMASWDAYSLSSIRQPISEMAETATQMLLRRISSPDSSSARFVTFPTDLVPRGTTAPPPDLGSPTKSIGFLDNVDNEGRV